MSDSAVLKRNIYDLELQLNQSRKRLCEATNELYNLKLGLASMKTHLESNSQSIDDKELLSFISLYVQGTAQM